MMMDIQEVYAGVVGGIQFILDNDHLSDHEKIEKINEIMVQYVNKMSRPLCSICYLPVLACDEFVNEYGIIHRGCR